jgi:Xaa-Pro aminopeptidase/Xaa-Pro dipeptidase
MKERRSILLHHTQQITGRTAIAAFEPENLFYLTGFWGEGIVICTNNSTKLIVPRLEYLRAQKTSVECEVLVTERGGQLFSSFIHELKDEKACSDCSDYSTVESIRNLGANMVVDTEPFFQTRRIKDDAEIRTISKASEILDHLFEICQEQIRIGLSERDLQAKLVYEGMVLGANPPSYKSTLNPLIIASGPNGALPHAEVTAREFRKGDMIVVDLTLRHSGYIADATRTFALGSVTNEMKEVYSIVQQSQKAGLDATKAGRTCGEIDSVCRNTIREHGYEKQFIHSTGHGIGLDVHEPPWLRMSASEQLRPNMTVTVEPGIYLPNKFGVRIEDSVIVTGNGKPEILNKFTKDLLIIK